MSISNAASHPTTDSNSSSSNITNNFNNPLLNEEQVKEGFEKLRK